MNCMRGVHLVIMLAPALATPATPLSAVAVWPLAAGSLTRAVLDQAASSDLTCTAQHDYVTQVPVSVLNTVRLWTASCQCINSPEGFRLDPEARLQGTSMVKASIPPLPQTASASGPSALALLPRQCQLAGPCLPTAHHHLVTEDCWHRAPRSGWRCMRGCGWASGRRCCWEPWGRLAPGSLCCTCTMHQQ